MKQFRYILRYYIDPGYEEDTRIGELVDFCKKSSIGEVMLFFNPEEVNNGHITIDELAPWLAMAKKIKHRDEILSLFSKAAREWIKKSDGYYEKCMSYLYRIIWRLKSEASVSYTTKSAETKISPAIEYIRENYTADSIKISHLASLCGISEVALRKQFQKQFAISPAVYIRNMRINYAKELMSNQDMSIADVAMLSGFNDVSYFSREFKKSEGISPKEYKSLHET